MLGDLVAVDDLADAHADVGQRHPLGWDPALSTYRAFVPYNELGSIANRTSSALFDMMSPALGIESLTEARAVAGPGTASREAEQRPRGSLHFDRRRQSDHNLNLT